MVRASSNVAVVVASFLVALLAVSVVLVSALPTMIAIYVAFAKSWSAMAALLLLLVAAANGFLLLSGYKGLRELTDRTMREKSPGKSSVLLYFLSVTALGALMLPLVL